jgi:hypothetical protein
MANWCATGNVVHSWYAPRTLTIEIRSVMLLHLAIGALMLIA